MANTETATTSSVYGQIDSTGAIGTITVKGSKLLDISVDFDTNSFVGTIQLQRETLTGASNIAEWQTIEEYTASAEKVAQSATTRRYRLNCSVDTSGTAEYEMTAGNFS
jgi:hypothetical protein